MLQTDRARASILDPSGAEVVSSTHRWFEAPSPEECRILDRLQAPVLDIGCGPGRHVGCLVEGGVAALGIDTAPAMVRVARRSGAPVLERSVFDHLPGGGSWGSVLLLDGNIGIGGDPLALLQRVRRLLRHDGFAVTELSPPGTVASVSIVHLQVDGEVSAPFAWATVSAERIDPLAATAGLRVQRAWSEADRWFAELSRA